jgi:hypothetical protein
VINVGNNCHISDCLFHIAILLSLGDFLEKTSQETPKRLVLPCQILIRKHSNKLFGFWHFLNEVAKVRISLWKLSEFSENRFGNDSNFKIPCKKKWF